MEWDFVRWPNFTPAEMMCKCGCGELVVDAIALDALQAMRDEVGALVIDSAHRCKAYNASIGGAPDSKHLGLAFDVALGTHTPRIFHDAALRAGFSGIGYGETYLHLDTRGDPSRWHYGEVAARRWTGWLFGFNSSYNKKGSVT